MSCLNLIPKHILMSLICQVLIVDLQVLASKTKIYMVLECVTGGDLFDRIVRLTYCYRNGFVN